MNHQLENDISQLSMNSEVVNGGMKKSLSGTFPIDNQPEKKVLVLYTGGTIGMVRNESGVLVPKPNALVKKIKKYPNMHDAEYASERFGGMGPLVLPITGLETRRIIYNILEYSPLCDSSNMTMDDWIRIAKDIKQSYEYFDGFVVLHGTDTLSYTASALSYMLEALGKIVILTGSQLPLFEARSDGLDNFLSSLLIAADYNIPEVCIFFGSELMRGNRTSKRSTSDFDAFDSPNFPPLATAGIKINVDHRSIFRSCLIEKFHVHSTLNRNVGLLRLFPSITADLVRAFLQPPIEGMVLQSYGCGNVPSNREDIMKELQQATNRGVIIVNITQCTKGTVSTTYETGKNLKKAGVTFGFDMTPEAALAKLAYVLSKTEWDTETKREMMQINLRGELTDNQPPSMKQWNPAEIVSQTMSLNSQEGARELSNILFPAMLCAAVVAQDTIKLDLLKGYGADVSQQNMDGRTALHVACCEGSIEMVQHLLNMGANVHVKDRYGRSPLIDAIDNDRHEIIKLLLKCGAHLYERSQIIGGRMCAAASTGNTNRLLSYHLAGADLSQSDVSGRSPLHLSALHNHTATAKFLLDHGADYKSKDILGQTAYDLAVLANAMDTTKLLGSVENQYS